MFGRDEEEEEQEISRAYVTCLVEHVWLFDASCSQTIMVRSPAFPSFLSSDMFHLVLFRNNSLAPWALGQGVASRSYGAQALQESNSSNGH